MLPGSRVRIVVAGVPKSAGSKTAWLNKHTGRMQYQDSCKDGWIWTEAVKVAFLQAYGVLPLPLVPRGHAVAVRCVFRMPRPKDHYRAGGAELRKGAPRWHVGTPDATKLWRRTEDALTGLLWADDAQVAVEVVLKRYVDPGEAPGCAIDAEWVAGGPVQSEILTVEGLPLFAEKGGLP